MTNSKTFRLFISSTFSNFQLERELLHKEVFPELEQYCESRGCQFQPIDLRWGVNFEAQLDQKTLQVCLDEVRACKHYPHPNFLIMAGERYGWVPLPYAIEKDEFEQIVHYHKQKDRSGLHLQNYPFEIALLQHWYQLDENHFMESDTQKIPRSCAYVLRAREDWSNEKNGSSKNIAIPFRKDYVTPNDEKKENNVNWNQDEGILLRALKEAVEHIKTKISQDAYSKYFLSATEQEVIEGICDYRHITHTQKYDETCSGQKHQIEKQYIHGYLRDVSDQEDLSNAQNKFRSQLEKALLLKNITRGSDAKAFAKEIKARLEIAIDDALKGQDDNSPQAILENERREQLAFRGSKLKGYVERTKSQSAITAYLESEESMQPFILHAPSGMGKSAVMAKAIESQEEELDSHKIVYRFVGATARSRDMRSLLIFITTEITQDHDRVYEEDSNKFNEQIKAILEKLKEPTILFIDALDQLLDREYLMWLPEILPAHLKIVLSVLNDPEYAQDSHYYNILQSRFNSADFFNLEEDPIEDTTVLIKTLLDLEQRTLTSQQQHYLSRQFEASKRSPLWMKIAIEEVKQWSSDQKEYELKVGVKAIINEFIDNLHEFYHHQPLLVEKVLGYIHASKDGLSEKELLDILSEDLHDEEVFQKQILNKFHDPIKVNNPRRGNQKELVLPLAHWSRLHVQLKPFLVTTNIDNQQLMKFFHRQFTTVIQERSAQQSQRYHTKLAEYFLTLQDKDQTWDQRYFNLRMLEETPYQLFKAKKTQQLKALLFDLEFAGSVYDHGKQQSFRAVMEKATELKGITEDEIYPWESFYREKEHLITRVNEPSWQAHQSLFQLAYEDGMNSPLRQKTHQLTSKVSWVWLKLVYDAKMSRTGLIKSLFLKDHDGRQNYFVQNLIKIGSHILIVQEHDDQVYYSYRFEYRKLDMSLIWRGEGEIYSTKDNQPPYIQSENKVVLCVSTGIYEVTSSGVFMIDSIKGINKIIEIKGGYIFSDSYTKIYFMTLKMKITLLLDMKKLREKPQGEYGISNILFIPSVHQLLVRYYEKCQECIGWDDENPIVENNSNSVDVLIDLNIQSLRVVTKDEVNRLRGNIRSSNNILHVKNKSIIFDTKQYVTYDNSSINLWAEGTPNTDHKKNRNYNLVKGMPGLLFSFKESCVYAFINPEGKINSIFENELYMRVQTKIDTIYIFTSFLGDLWLVDIDGRLSHHFQMVKYPLKNITSNMPKVYKLNSEYIIAYTKNILQIFNTRIDGHALIYREFKSSIVEVIVLPTNRFIAILEKENNNITSDELYANSHTYFIRLFSFKNEQIEKENHRDIKWIVENTSMLESVGQYHFETFFSNNVLYIYAACELKKYIVKDTEISEIEEYTLDFDITQIKQLKHDIKIAWGDPYSEESSNIVTMENILLNSTSHTKSIIDIIALQEGGYLSYGKDNKIIAYDNSWKEIVHCNEHKTRINLLVEIAPNIIVSSSNNKIIVWDITLNKSKVLYMEFNDIQFDTKRKELIIKSNNIQRYAISNINY